MSISSVSSVSHAHGAAQARKSAMQQASTDFSTLTSALGSNNLSAAKSAFATLQKDVQSVSATQGSPTTAQTSAMHKIKSDAQTLSTALSTGNLAAAQQAFATLKQDSASAQRMHGHHGHHGMRVASSGSSASTGSTSSDLLATQAISSVGGTLNVTA